MSISFWNSKSKGVIFLFSRHEDLKQMLDSNKDGLKLEAMKRIIGVSTFSTAFHLSFSLFEK